MKTFGLSSIVPSNKIVTYWNCNEKFANEGKLEEKIIK